MQNFRLLSMIVLGILLVFSIGGTGAQSGQWAVTYYDNASLTGTPDLVRTESSPSFDANRNAPTLALTPNNWSARWQTTLDLAPAVYQISVRADDGVRVYVAGNLVIDEWHIATGITYTAQVELSGPTSFRVEYYEGTGLASLQYNLQRITGPPVPSPEIATATVDVSRLNLRTEPDILFGDVIQRISEDETYPALAFNLEETWVQINVNGTIGWVSRPYVTLNRPELLSVIEAEPERPDNTPIATVIATNLNVRDTPSTSTGAVLTQIQRGEQYFVLAQTPTAAWVQINVDGLIGWVSNRFVDVDNQGNIPVVPL